VSYDPAHDAPDLTPDPRLSSTYTATATTALTVGEPQTIAKAVVAVTGALATAITTALSDGRVTVWELVIGGLVALGSGAAVWATSNRP
jgi:hypothetical protein